VEFLKTPTVEQKTCQSFINNVNKLVKEQAEGRLFAVIHLCGKQYKVTAGDILVIEGYWPPTIGDKLRLEKVKQHKTFNAWMKL
jgi:large subunit ribosomal protein L21